jgi:hypothetical protein
MASSEGGGGNAGVTEGGEAVAQRPFRNPQRAGGGNAAAVAGGQRFHDRLGFRSLHDTGEATALTDILDRRHRSGGGCGSNLGGLGDHRRGGHQTGRAVEMDVLRADFDALAVLAASMAGVGQQQGAAHHILQLADIARPAVHAQHGEGTVADPGHRRRALGRVAQGQGESQRCDVVQTLAQGAQRQGKTFRR